MIRINDIEIDQIKIKIINEWPEPKNYKEIQIFLDFANFYRRFILRYSKVIKPLTDLLKGMMKGRKSGPFYFTREARAAFKKLKERFCQAA
jgi:hypothetical protein